MSNMEINSNDKIQTEGNEILPKKDKNSVIKKRIGYFKEEKGDNNSNIYPLRHLLQHF